MSKRIQIKPLDNILKEWPLEYGGSEEGFLNMPIHILKEDGTTIPTGYTNRNSHELLMAWSRGELAALSL